MSLKELYKYTSDMNILYVEDDIEIVNGFGLTLKEIFKDVDIVYNGYEALKKYDIEKYDIIISDINMPIMNGVDMISEIRKQDMQQRILVTSAHNDTHILIDLIKLGVNSFILKPITIDEFTIAIMPIAADLFRLKENIKLNKQILSKDRIITHKSQQLETILTKNSIDEYFSLDIQDNEPVFFISEHADDLVEYFDTLPDILYLHNDDNMINKFNNNLNSIIRIFNFYTPYMDLILGAFIDLNQAIKNNPEKFKNLCNDDIDSVLMLFDSISSDMLKYIKRFSNENMVMKNIHHIHEPTALSIKQVIGMFDEIECGELEFFN